MELTHISLFSGAVDGISVAAEWAGFRNIIVCEKDEYCREILKKNNHGTIIYDDVLTMPTLPHATLLSAGIPCQQHSDVNKGKTGDDFEWNATKTRIKECKPHWIIIENVNGILNTIHEKICIDLESQNYEVETYNIPAVAVGAPHERYRVFIVANSCSEPVAQADKAIGPIGKERNPWQNDLRTAWGTLPGTYWGIHKPPVCGVDDGLTQRFYKDRMRALGNPVVPQQVYPILQAIADIEMMLSS